MYKIYTAVVSLSFEGFFPLHHKSHHSFITNLRILKNEGVTAPSSPSIKPQAAHVDSRRGSGRLAFPSAIYRSHFWCMNKGVSPFPSLLVNSFYSPQFVDFSVGKAGGRGGGAAQTHDWRRDRKSPWEKIMIYHENFGEKQVPWILATEIFDDNILKALVLSRILGNDPLAVL